MKPTPTILPATLLALLALTTTPGCGSSGSKAKARMIEPQGNEAVVTSTGLPYRPTAPVFAVDPPAGFRPELNPPAPLSSVPSLKPTTLLLASPLRPYREPKATNDWVTAAKGWRGTPFVEGGSDRQGADSAGYVVQLHKEVASTAVATTPAEIWTSGKPVGIAAFEPGDIVFFGDLNSLSPIHVGVYVGERSFTHSSVGTGVSFASLDDTYWKPRFLGARRPQR
ncbi:MAG: NlpC/P60 family protein [Verrucomicrobiota bacterium]|nr:NlpC/P60 family protein [Verrucomicrobiota bacterium]